MACEYLVPCSLCNRTPCAACAKKVRREQAITIPANTFKQVGDRLTIKLASGRPKGKQR